MSTLQITDALLGILKKEKGISSLEELFRITDPQNCESDLNNIKLSLSEAKDYLIKYSDHGEWDSVIDNLMEAEDYLSSLKNYLSTSGQDQQKLLQIITDIINSNPSIDLVNILEDIVYQPILLDNPLGEKNWETATLPLVRNQKIKSLVTKSNQSEELILSFLSWAQKNKHRYTNIYDNPQAIKDFMSHK